MMVKKVLRILERQGAVGSFGRGKRRQIKALKSNRDAPLQVGIPGSDSADSSHEPVISAKRLLTKSGHTWFFPIRL